MTAPDRIWTDRDTYWIHPAHKADKHEYILHTRAALAASPLVQEIVAEAVNEALDDVTTLHRVIADIRMATVGSKPMLSDLAAALVAWRAEAVKAEREACARVCETLGALGGVTPNPRAEWKTHADNLAAAIRARGEG